MKRLTAYGHAKEALKRIKHARYYAADDATLLAIGALLSEWQSDRAARGENFTQEAADKFLEGLRDYVPSLFQKRPPDEKEPAKLWIDPVSGQSPPNPFAKATLNLSEQTWLVEHEPELASYLRETADRGVSYSFLQKQRDEKEAREKIRAIEYGEAEHQGNVFRDGNLSAKNAFRRAFGDAVSDFYEREAKTPVQLPWIGEQNLTLTGQLFVKAPDLHALVKRSVTTAREWATETLHESEKQFGEAQARRRSAETLLGTSRATVA
jgi:hypothetical protein